MEESRGCFCWVCCLLSQTPQSETWVADALWGNLSFSGHINPIWGFEGLEAWCTACTFPTLLDFPSYLTFFLLVVVLLLEVEPRTTT